jgi:hypothetical protein
VQPWTGIGWARVTPAQKRTVFAPVGGQRIVRPPRPRKPGLELSWEVTTAQREPPWNAERRAVPAGTAPRPLARVVTTRLSAFHILILFFRSPG